MRVTDEPLAVRGTLALQQEAPDGVLYRLEHAIVLAPRSSSPASRPAGKTTSADRGCRSEQVGSSLRRSIVTLLLKIADLVLVRDD